MSQKACVGAYVAVIDPLKSVEVTPAVNSVAFVPRRSPTVQVLCSNEKVPKMYKLIECRDSPLPTKATDVIGSSRVGPLTLPVVVPALKHVATFAMEHEYRIHSILPLQDGLRFLSVDDVEAKLWCAEYTDVPLDVVSIKPSGEEEPKDTFLSAYVSPVDPVLFFITTYSGVAQVFDVRQRLRWTAQDSLRFSNNTPSDQPPCILSVAHSPCGNLIAGRDATSVLLWDTRRPGAPVSRWEVQPLDDRALSSKSDVRFSSSGDHVFTGCDEMAIAVVNVHEPEVDVSFITLIPPIPGAPSMCSRDEMTQRFGRDGGMPLSLVTESRRNTIIAASQNSAHLVEYA